MRSALIRLKPFERAPELNAFSCSVQVRRESGLLMLCYSVAGPLEHLVLPPAAPRPGFAPGLWRSTCLECFLHRENSPAYTEWNFSPSGNWWTCFFDGYRAAAPHQSAGLCPEVRAHQTPGRLMLRASVQTGDAAMVRIDPAAVFEHASGLRSHWAMAHPFERPDFHQPSGRGFSLHEIHGE